MAMPPITKTWQYNVNQTLGTYGDHLTQQQSLLFALKQSLIGFATSPWTVVGSCNSVSFSLDGTDRWLASTNLVWSASGQGIGVRSWIVLKQTGMGANFQICISCQAGGGTGPAASSISFIVSPSAGFTGGNTLNRPTATDEFALLAGSFTSRGGYWVLDETSGSPSANRFVLHATQSTDGTVTRIHFWRNNLSMAHILIGKAVETPGGAEIVTAAYISPNGTDGSPGTYFNYARLNDNSSVGIYYNGSFTHRVAHCSAEHFTTNSVGEQITVANEISGEWNISPAGLVSTTSPFRGRLGRIPDIWWTSTGLADADTFPSSGTQLYAVFGDMVTPWNGTTPLVA